MFFHRTPLVATSEMKGVFGLPKIEKQWKVILNLQWTNYVADLDLTEMNYFNCWKGCFLCYCLCDVYKDRDFKIGCLLLSFIPWKSCKS